MKDGETPLGETRMMVPAKSSKEPAKCFMVHVKFTLAPAGFAGACKNAHSSVRRSDSRWWPHVCASTFCVASKL